MDENEQKLSPEESSTRLKSNEAGLLCYVAGWITGVVFLIIEKKSTLVRFHAMQSLVSFGILFIAISIADNIRRLTGWAGQGISLFPLEVATNAVFGIFIALTIVLWIILMHQTHHGRFVKVPLFGELALELLARLDNISKEDFLREMKIPGRKVNSEYAPAEEPRTYLEKAPSYYMRSKKAGRIASSVGTIVWSIILLVLFNFFSRYIACYHGRIVDGATVWNMYPLLTPNFKLLVLPFLNVVLTLSIIGHSIAIAFDRYILREIIKIVLNILSLAAIITFLRVFPLDFSVVPHAGVATISPTVTIAILTIIAVVIAIEALVRLIRLIINILT
jgi:uncharacterized membrane protein